MGKEQVIQRSFTSSKTLEGLYFIVAFNITANCNDNKFI